MKFLTPAFVRVENPQERKELTEWLMNIGYEIDPNGADISDDRTHTVAVTMIESGFYHGNAYWFQYWVSTSQPVYACHIDCGTDIRLFKALAAMNDKNDREQWFVCENALSECRYMVGTFELSRVDKFPKMQNPGTFWRKATAEEIINHFEN